MSDVFISTGEASGDLYGSYLALAIREMLPEVKISGNGSKLMRQAGVNLIEDSSNWGAISIVQSLKVVPKVLLSFFRTKKYLHAQLPKLIVAIDFGAFNVPLCHWAKKQGIKVIYYMPPGAWRKEKQGKDLPNIADAVATPFQWSEEILQKMGANVKWVGHPLLDIVINNVSTQEFYIQYHLDIDKKFIGIFPGSRLHEVEQNIPVIARTLELVKHRLPSIQIVGARSPNITAQILDKLWRRCTDLPAIWLEGENYGIMSNARASIVCSGTVTLEAAILHCPMLVIYCVSKWTYLEYKIRKPKFDFISLPNILADTPFVPEYIQEQADPYKLCEKLIELIEDTEPRCSQIKAFQEIQNLLGAPGATNRTAEMALEYLTN